MDALKSSGGAPVFILRNLTHNAIGVVAFYTLINEINESEIHPETHTNQLCFFNEKKARHLNVYQETDPSRLNPIIGQCFRGSVVGKCNVWNPIVFPIRTIP